MEQMEQLILPSNMKSVRCRMSVSDRIYLETLTKSQEENSIDV